jgi:predicted acyltransferase
MNSPLHRSQAIDVMRGVTLALMIVVNMSISDTLSYVQLLHAPWHGLTLTDLVFPTFLFVVGTALAFTLDKYQRLGTSTFLAKTFRRTVLIFLCGYLLYWFPFFEFDTTGQLALIPFGRTRIPGVLQRIALTYCLASLILHYGGRRAAVAYSIVTLLGYWWILGSFGDYSLTGNAALQLDKLLLGEAHLYKGEGIPFDPEGILGTLPAVVNVLAGYLAGRFVRERGATPQSITMLLSTGVICLLAAWLWDGAFPINKKLWTSSYVIGSIGVDLIVLGLLSYNIDLAGHRRWTYFFEVFGRNTLFLYLFSEIVSGVFWLTPVGDQTLFMWLYANGFQWWAGDRNGSLLFALTFMAGCWLVGYAMDRRKIYIRL